MSSTLRPNIWIYLGILGVLAACGAETTPPPAGLGYSAGRASYTWGVAIQPNVPTYQGGRATRFEVSPALPDGLVLDEATGVISGTPTEIAAPARFTAVASNAGGKAEATIWIEVVEAPPRDLVYAESAPVYTRGRPIAPAEPTHTGGLPEIYTVTPPLPRGLSIDGATGVISGTPEAVSPPARYEVRASNGAGASATLLTITVNEAPPADLAYELGAAVYTRGEPIAENRPVMAGGEPTLFRVTPELPAGLRMDARTGVIGGTPADVTPETTYEVRASNAAGSSAALITIRVNDVAPSSLVYAAPVAVYPRTVPISPNRPSSAGGAVTSYEVSPELPAGLALDPATGVISGTPANVSPSTTYVVTASNTGGSTTTEIGISVLTLADASRPMVNDDVSTSTPFARYLVLTGSNLDRVSTAGFKIAARPGAVSKPISVTYGSRYMLRRGFLVSSRELRVLVFGLYDGASNSVDLLLTYTDGSEKKLVVGVTAERWIDTRGIYGAPAIRAVRRAGDDLGFDYFWIKSGLGSPVVMDTDGKVRWIAPGIASASSSLMSGGAFVVGTGGPSLTRLELDGTSTSVLVNEPRYDSFHHDMAPGKVGVLGLMDGKNTSGVPTQESMIAEISATGSVLREWDIAAIISNEMREGGDDPSGFVRDGSDWFHVNSAEYVPEDDSLLVSSRENFAMKIDHASGAIRWIFGDPTKYWGTFPTLRARALTLTQGVHPIGQHSVSWPASGELLLFNNGHASLNNPDGTPAGEELGYSEPSRYVIDEATGEARQIWSYDAGKAIKSSFASSVFEAAPGSYLVTYSIAGGSTAKLVGLAPGNRVAFDFEFPSRNTTTAWNARPLVLEGMRLME